MHFDSLMKTNSLAVIAIVSALGMIGVIGVSVLLTIQQIDAEQPPTKGCRTSIAVNASEGRCFQGDR